MSTIASKGGSIPTIDFGVRGEFGTLELRRCCRPVQEQRRVEGLVFVKIERYSLQLTAMSSSGDDDPGHNHAMSYGVREINLRGFHVVKGMTIGKICPKKLRKAIHFKLELDFGQGFSRWEAISGRNASRK
jgi:hypothetical protein